jgi:hypothetical protein
MGEMSRAERMMREELVHTLEMVAAPSAAETEARSIPSSPAVGGQLGRVFRFGVKGDARKEILLEVVASEGLTDDMIISALQEFIDHLKGGTGNVTAPAP